MKKLILAIATLLCLVNSSFSQTSYYPSCWSNASKVTLDSIASYGNSTFVYLEYYNYQNSGMFINPGMYIENYNRPGSGKCYIKAFAGNEMNKIYTLSAFTKYNFTLEFERVPGDWGTINILEPPSATPNYVSWYWKNLVLNVSESYRIKLDRFFLDYALATLKSSVHPFTTLTGYTYTVDQNSIRVVLYYDGAVTDLVIYQSGGFITNIAVLYNYDSLGFAAFSAVDNIKSLLIKSTDKDTYSNFEKFLRKTVDEMTGKELTCMYLTGQWAGMK